MSIVEYTVGTEVPESVAGGIYDSAVIAYFTGLVDAVNGPPTFGPASGYSYDIWVNTPENPKVYEKMAPAVERWDDSIDVIPIRQGTMVTIGCVNGVLLLLNRELPHIEPCGGAAPASSVDQIIGVLARASVNQKANLRKALGL